MSKITCQKCQKSFETLQLGTSVESFVCPVCGKDNKITPLSVSETTNSSDLQLADESASHHDGEPDSRSRSEWDSGWRTDTLNAYINTVKSVLTSPIECLGNLKPTSDYAGLALFIFVNSFVSILFSMGYQLVLGLAFDPTALVGIPFLICAVLFVPFVATGIAFLVAGILHLCYTFIGGSEEDFDVTMTVYGLGSAANLFAVIPFVGGLVQFVYAILINIFAQAKAHRISNGKAALSVFLPFLVICCCAGTIMFGAGLTVGSLGVFLDSLGH